jgi:hypothetical protein
MYGSTKVFGFLIKKQVIIPTNIPMMIGVYIILVRYNILIVYANYIQNIFWNDYNIYIYSYYQCI